MAIQILDFKRRFQRGIGSSPFRMVPVAELPFTLYGMLWCPTCEMEVDCDTHAANRGTLYLYKRLCRRCGTVLQRGIYDKTMSPIPHDAADWVNAPGKDRR